MYQQTDISDTSLQLYAFMGPVLLIGGWGCIRKTHKVVFFHRPQSSKPYTVLVDVSSTLADLARIRQQFPSLQNTKFYALYHLFENVSANYNEWLSRAERVGSTECNSALSTVFPLRKIIMKKWYIKKENTACRCLTVEITCHLQMEKWDWKVFNIYIVQNSGQEMLSLS